MAIFMITPTSDQVGPIKDALLAKEKEQVISVLELPKGEFFVSYKGTSKELSDLLGISDGKVPNAIVTLVTSYFGRASTNIWEWVKTHWE